MPTAPPMNAADLSPLADDDAARPGGLTMQPLGLAPPAEALYRALLRAPGSSCAAAAQAARLPADMAPALLEGLLHRGLVSRPEATHDAWWPTAPEVAVELLLMERQVELNHARQILPELQQDLRRGGRGADGHDVQIIGGGAQQQLPAYLQIHHAARHEVACVVCPPFSVSAPDEMQAAREQARRRGVRYRTIISPEVMQWPGWLESARQVISQGEQVRVLADLPFKMVLADRHSALVPLRTGEQEGPSLKLGPTAVLHALWALFDALWQQAAPVLTAEAALPAAPDAAEEELHALVMLMAAGANDKSIADVLGISERTLLRRITALGTRLHARSRVQCGWLAARQWDRPDA
ncbi:MAG: hypothetical protein HY856_09550 [Burkholderiales bacterium]|nr:hypothetical protein [Burkholderiales bacterium]